MKTNVDNHINVVYQFFRSANEYGVWSFISASVEMALFCIGLKLIFPKKHRVKNLNFVVYKVRDSFHYPLRIFVEIRNYTGRTVVISLPYFKYSGLKPDPKAAGDSITGEYELKFDPEEMVEVEWMLRHKGRVKTWIPIHPAHTDDEVDSAIDNFNVGTLYCFCTWIEEKPYRHPLIRVIGRKTG